MAKTYVSLADIVDTTALAVDETADTVAIPIKATVGSGDNLDPYSGIVPSRLDVRIGTSGSPDLGGGAPIKVSRTVGHTAAQRDALTGQSGNDGSDILNAIYGDVHGTTSTQVQTVGIRGTAANEGTTTPGGGVLPDASAGYFTGGVDGAGIGTGIGACLYGFTHSSSSSSGAVGCEIVSWNERPTNAAHLDSSVRAAWIHAGGGRHAGVGLHIGNPMGAQFQTGIKFDGTGASNAFVGSTTGATIKEDIRSDSAAETSFLVNGSHTYGIDFTGGTFSGAAIRDEPGVYQEYPGTAPLRWGMALGSSGSPITVGKPNIKLSRYENINSTEMPNPASNERNAIISLVSNAPVTSTPQVSCINAVARGGGTTGGADVCPISAVGILSNSTANGFGMGAYFEGRRSVTTGNAYGVEITIANDTATSGTYNPAGASDTMGIWLPSRGDASGSDNAVGIALAGLGSPNSQFKVGYACLQDSIANEAFRDDSNAVTSLLINGSHTYGIDLNGGAYSGSQIRLKNDAYVKGRNGAGSADVNLFKIDTGNYLEINSGLTLSAETTNSAKLYVSGGVTLSSSNSILSFQTGIRPSAAGVSSIYGILAIPIITDVSGTSNNVTGPVHAIFARPDIWSSYTATVSEMRGLTAGNPNKNGGSATITTYKGINIEALNAATTNYAIYVEGANNSFFADGAGFQFGTSTGFKIGTGATQKIGLWGATPVVQDTGWSATNVTTDRSFDANNTTIDELADVLGTLINQLKTYGNLGA